MKKFFCLIGLTVGMLQAGMAQFKEYSPTTSTMKDAQYEPEIDYSYVVLSAGIDNYVGIFGIGMEIPVSKWIKLKGGVGLGAWGLKFSGGLKYQASKKWAYGLGYSHCPGIQNIDITIDDGSTSKVVNMDLLKCGSVNFSANRDFYLSQNVVFYLETGLAFATGGSKPYRTNDGTILTEDDELLFDILRPGGITLAGGFKIGF